MTCWNFWFFINWARVA